MGDYLPSTETIMNILQKLSGIAVLLLALHFIHAIHFFMGKAAHDDPWFWLMMVAAAAVDIFAFLGGYLLLRSSR